MEQHVRDARIAQIYEGTNGIQALDLVGRKMGAHAGRYLRRFFHPVLAYIEARSEDPAMADEFILPLSKAFGRLQAATAEVARRGLGDPFEAGPPAPRYPPLLGLTPPAHVLAPVAGAPPAQQAAGGTRVYPPTPPTARVFLRSGEHT